MGRCKENRDTHHSTGSTLSYDWTLLSFQWSVSWVLMKLGNVSCCEITGQLWMEDHEWLSQDKTPKGWLMCEYVRVLCSCNLCRTHPQRGTCLGWLAGLGRAAHKPTQRALLWDIRIEVSHSPFGTHWKLSQMLPCTNSRLGKVAYSIWYLKYTNVLQAFI